jgi:hypothetical protein
MPRPKFFAFSLDTGVAALKLWMLQSHFPLKSLSRPWEGPLSLAPTQDGNKVRWDRQIRGSGRQVILPFSRCRQASCFTPASRSRHPKGVRRANVKISWFVVAAVLGGSLMSAGPVAAQQDVATYGKEAMDDLVGLLRKAAKDGYSMEASTSTMFGGWLPRGRKQGNERWVPMLTLRNLDPNKQYRIIASGDNDTIDLDLRILDPTGKVVAQDVTIFRDAEVTFRPARQQDYVIELRLFESRDNCFCLGAILRR